MVESSFKWWWKEWKTRRLRISSGNKKRVVQRGKPNEVGRSSGQALKCWI